jgi:hypothetical protein
MSKTARHIFQPQVLLAFCIAAAAVSVTWFLVLATRSFYPAQGGDPTPRLDSGLPTHVALALACLAVVVVLLFGARSTRGTGRASRVWLAAALALFATLLALALTAGRFLHPVTPLGDSPLVYSGEAGLWATYFWVSAAGLLAFTVLLLVSRARRR